MVTVEEKRENNKGIHTQSTEERQNTGHIGSERIHRLVYR